MSAAGLLEMLRERGWRVGAAESLTGGALCATLVDVPGASDVVAGGVVAYATELKHSVLGVDSELLAREGAVHPEVAEQMADGVRSALAIDARRLEVGLATTGVAGPASPEGKPVGTVYIGVSTPLTTVSRRFHFDGDRSEIRAQTVEAAVGLLYELVSTSRE